VRAEVTYEEQQAVVTYDPAKVTVARMIAAIKTLNYTATVVPGRQPAPNSKRA
jgi:copper chaperone CopZ